MKILSSWDLLHGKTADKNKHSTTGSFYQPLQMVEDSEKDQEWLEANIDWFETLGMMQLSHNYPKMVKNYELAAGIINKNDYVRDTPRAEVNPHENIGETLLDFTEDFSLPEAMEITFYPIIPNVIKLLLGEFSKRYQEVQVQAVDQFSKNEKLDAKFEKIREYAVNINKAKLFNKLIESGFQPKSEEELTKAQQEIDTKVQSLPEIQELFTKDYRSMVEQWAQHQIREDDQRFNMYELENQAFADYIKVDKQYWHISLGEDDYNVEVWDPRTTFSLMSRDTKYVSRGNCVGRMTTMSIADAIDKYREKLHEHDISSLETLYHSTTTNILPYGSPDDHYYDTSRPYHDQSPNDLNVAKRLGTDSMSMSGLYNFFPREDNNKPSFEEYINSDINTYDKNLVRITEVYWKSQKKMGYVTSIDDSGALMTEIVTGNYKITTEPIYDTKFYKKRDKKSLVFGEHVDWFWINEIYGGKKIDAAPLVNSGLESNKFSNDLSGQIYFDCGPLKFQFKSEGSLWDALLPVEGLARTDLRISTGVSPVDLMAPWQILHNLSTNQAKDLLIDERGTVVLLDQNMIPSNSMGEDWGKNNLDKVGFAMDTTGILPVDTSITHMGDRTGFSHFQTLNLEQSKRFATRVSIAQWAKEEAFSTIGITPQRLGSISSQETATGINQAINNSYSQTEMYFVEHINFLMPKVRNMMINAAQYYNSTEPSMNLQYMNDNNETIMFQMEGYELLAKDLQVYTSFKPNAKGMMEQMKQMVLQNNTTNANIHDLLKIMTANTPAEVIQAAKKSVEDFNSQTEAQNKHQQEMLEKQLQSQAAEKEKDKAFEAQENQLDRENDIAESTIRAMGFANDTDLNKDSTPDLLQIEKFGQEMSRFQQNLALQKDKLNLDSRKHQEGQQLKREEIAARRDAEQKKLEVARENQSRSELEAKKKIKAQPKKKS